MEQLHALFGIVKLLTGHFGTIFAHIFLKQKRVYDPERGVVILKHNNMNLLLHSGIKAETNHNQREMLSPPILGCAWYNIHRLP